MGDNALIVQIGLGLLVIFFFVTIGFSVRTWKFAHLFFLSLTFIGAITFTIFAAMVLKTHGAWRVEVQKMQADLETQLKTKDNVQFGDVNANPEPLNTRIGADVTKAPADAAQKIQEANLRSVKAEIGRVLLDRGRVWRGCQPGNFDGDSVTVTTASVAAPPPAPAPVDPAAPPADPMAPAVPAPAPPAQAAKTNNIEVKSILYAFKELPNADNTMFLPGEYLGEFVATAVTESSVTLAPTIALDADQLQQIRNVDSTWALYEVLPVDGHEFFVGMTEEQLRALIPQGKLVNEVYDAMIQSYLRTGGPATDDDPPETRYWSVIFTKKKTIDVDSDQMGVTDVNFFDQQGRSVASRLRRGEAVEFDLTDTAIVDEETANAWAAAGEVKKDRPIYMRPLNDYAKLFHFFFQERQELASKIDLVTRETASIDNSTKLAEGQVMKLMDEQTKLESDKMNYTAERDAVVKLEQELVAQSEQLRKQLSATYLANQQLAAELAVLQKQLADEIAKADSTKTAALVK